MRVVSGCFVYQKEEQRERTAGPGTVYVVYVPYRLNRIPGSFAEYAPGKATPAGFALPPPVTRS